MIDPATQLKRLTDRCTVQVLSQGITGGSGFFIAPGIVISCAHVVKRRGEGETADFAWVQWGDATYRGLVRALPGSHLDPDHLWPYPDLCVIALDDLPADHPWVLLDDSEVAGGTEVYLAGFSHAYDPTSLRLQGKTGWLDEPQELDGILWQVRDCEVAEGLSGGPVLDVRRGVVCAVTKAQRAPLTTIGGLLIPASAIRNALPEAWESATRAWYQTPAPLWMVQWRKHRAELRAKLDPLSDLVRPRQLDALASAGTALGLSGADVKELWWQVVEPGYMPPPDADFVGVTDLAAGLADLMPIGLHPVIKLYCQLADMLTRIGRLAHGRELRTHARTVAERADQLHAFEEYRDQLKRAPATEVDDKPQPFIVIRVQGNPQNEKEAFLWIWSYQNKEPPARPVRCARGPHQVQVIERIVTKVLAKAISELPPARRPVIEFALPDHLLDWAVESWQIDQYSLGVDYPVVVRFTGRNPLQERQWKARCEELRTRSLPPRHSPTWADLWIGCQDPRSPREINAMLQRNGRLPVIAMTEWRLPVAENAAGNSANGRLPAAIEAAKHAGAPVAFWQHARCADHELDADVAATVQCRGYRFRDAVAGHLSAVRLDQLPEQVRQLRAKSAECTGDPAHFSYGVAILWDDAARAPWDKVGPSKT